MTKLVVVGGEGGPRTSGGHVATDLTVRLNRGFLTELDATLCVQGPTWRSVRPLPDAGHVRYLPTYDSKWQFLRKRSRIREVLQNTIRCGDTVLVRLPSFHGVEAVRIARAKRGRAVPFWVGNWEDTLGDLHEWQTPIYQRLARTLTVEGTRGCDLVLAQGRPLARYLAGLGIVATPVVESPLEREDFDLVDENSLTSQASEFSLVTFARLARSKNLESLIQAVATLSARGVAVRLSIAGQGGSADRLREMVERLRIDDRVAFLGGVEDRGRLRRLLATAHAFVFPSLSEGVPLSLLEAMAAGVPIVSTMVGGIPDILVPGQNALALEEATPGAICAEVSRLLDKPDLRLHLSRGGRDVARRFTHEAWVRRFAELAGIPSTTTP